MNNTFLACCFLVSFVGDNNGDSPVFVLQNMDGYYLIGGNTTSSANDDVTGNNYGASDIWIITLTAAGKLNE